MSNNETDLGADIDALAPKLAKARKQIAKRIIGQAHVVDQALMTLLCGGHGLLVGVPGLAKTRLVDTLGIVMGLKTSRIQFTPDLMPADILGSEILDIDEAGNRSFRFVQGPVFSELLMADEINRASPRTQSALLQAMQEKEVSIAGKTHKLAPPFHVLATQNPIEQEGTYPLPEAQLDRFLMQINVHFPDRDTEREILLATTGADESKASPVFSAQELIEAQDVLRRMPVGDAVLEAILDLVRMARPDEPTAPDFIKNSVNWGPGPRAAQALMMAVRGRALLEQRLVPSVDDVKALAHPILVHRMSLSFAARAEGVSLGQIIDQLADQVTNRARAA